MSSIDITSTNDMTSTAAPSDTSGSFAGDAAHHATNALTTDAIIRECIKQGFYRNPICNEKLYLHNRGFDSIAPTAFEPYTDVKVLWLEGNGFATMPCGVGFTQVQPPVRVDPFAEAAEDTRKEAQEHHVDPTSLEQPPTPNPLPLPADVPAEERDAFSSLYPTVRQLYLHNNLFRVMPDLSRFQRLDSVNLSGNFISVVEPHCPHWDRTAASHEDGADGAAENVSQEHERTNVPGGTVQDRTPPSRHLHTQAEEKLALVPSTADATAQRAAQLERCRCLADHCAVRCAHCPLPEREEEAAVLDEHGRPVLSRPYIPRQPPMPAPEYRNPCSSLRSLNLAGNRLESFEDCIGLLAYKALAVLDLSHNNILDGEALLLLLERLPRLQSLKLSGNPLVRTLPRYRKRLLSRCKQLLYLDDRPVFEEERRLVTAWALAGGDGEEKERHLIQQEKLAAERKRLDDFRRLIARSHSDDAGAPHADFVRAITTSAALSAAADTAASVQGNAPRAHRPSRRSRRSPPGGRRPSSDPDNSPTSSDSGDNDDDDDVDGDAGAEQLTVRSRGAAAGVVGAHGEEAVAITAADIIAPVHENSNKAARPDTSQANSTRVLSSNQRITSHNDHLDEDDADDIFVPQS